MRKYYSLIVRTAFRHSLDHTQTVLFILFIIAGVATALVRSHAPKLAAMIPDVSGWQIAAIVLGTIVLARLILAPYWIYKEGSSKIGIPAPPIVIPLDVVEAKLKLAEFVMNALLPAVIEADEAIRRAADVIKDWDPQSPQALFAWNGVFARIPPRPNVNLFNSADSIRNSPLPALEGMVRSDLEKYRNALSYLNLVIKATASNRALAARSGFVKQIGKWLPIHETLKAGLAGIIKDIHFPILKRQTEEGLFDLKQYPEQVVHDFISTS
ncbi:MAG TPA: hypothetical protein VHX92_01775 [Rhizomicrobium sp.]|jgi:hypothetical protein|nr:hypothetical protein [Rhizomicrobium sp.]